MSFTELIQVANSKANLKDQFDIQNLHEYLDALRLLLSKIDHNNSSEFCDFFVKFLDVVFGELVTVPDVYKTDYTSSSHESMSSNRNGIGWLTLLAYSTSGSTISNDLLSSTINDVNSNFDIVHSQNVDINPSSYLKGFLKSLNGTAYNLLTNLTPHNPIFEILSKQKILVKTCMLPFKLQQFFADHAATTYFATNNLYQLAEIFNQFRKLSSGIKFTEELAFCVDPFSYFLLCLIRFPSVSNIPLNVIEDSNDHNSLFDDQQGLNNRSFRHGGSSLFRNDFQRKTVVDILHQNGLRGWLDRSPYLVLLDMYLIHFLGGSDGVNANTPSVKNNIKYNETLQFHRELFMDLIIQYWIDVATIIRVSHHHISDQITMKSIAEQEGYVHPCATETIALDKSSFHWTIGTLQCTYITLTYLLRFVEKESLLFTYQQSAVQDQQRITTNIESNKFKSSRSCQDLLKMQTPLYDMIRTIFNLGHDATKADADVILLTIEIWLVWIEPWKYCQSMLPHDAESYESWSLYIAANLHFYTTLFICYLRFVSKIDFTGHGHPVQKHLETLERVLNIFEQPLLNKVIDMSQEFREYIIGTSHQRNRNPYHPSSIKGHETSFKTSTSVLAMKGQHYALYPDREIDERNDNGILIMPHHIDENCEKIAHRLKEFDKSKLSSIGFISYIISKLMSRLGLYFSESYSQRRKVLNCVSGLENISQAVLDNMEVNSLSYSRMEREARINPPDRLSETVDFHQSRDLLTGKLTTIGKQRIQLGSLKCQKNDVRFNGHDPMEVPICNNESKYLAKCFMKLSHYLNKKYNLPRDPRWKYCPWKTMILEIMSGRINALYAIQQSFRFNFRFLARIRTLAFHLWVIFYIMNWNQLLSDELYWILFITCAIFGYIESWKSVEYYLLFYNYDFSWIA